jgi:hypothetical protein
MSRLRSRLTPSQFVSGADLTQDRPVTDVHLAPPPATAIPHVPVAAQGEPGLAQFDACFTSNNVSHLPPALLDERGYVGGVEGSEKPS